MIVMDRSIQAIKNTIPDFCNNPTSIQSFYLHVLLKHTSELISIWDHNATLLFATPSHTDYFGKRFPKNLEKLLLFVHPEDREIMQKKIEESLLLSKRTKVLYRFVKKNRKNTMIESTFDPVLGQDGVLKFLVVVSRDITETKEYEKKMKEKQQMFHSLFEFNPDAVFSLDVKGKITSVNHACELLTGYRRKELLTHHFSKMVRKRDIQKIRVECSKLKSGIPVTLQVGINRCDGKEVEIQVTNIPIYVDNKLSGYYGFAKKITENCSPNRAYFEERLQEAIESEEPFSLFIVDIDRLKVINDNLGYHCGDILLMEFFQKLKRITGPNDIVARLDGDEFGILLKRKLSKKDIGSFVNRLFDMLQHPFVIEQHELTIHVSVGISRFPKDGLDKRQLLKKASLAINKAKESRENCCQVYSSSLETDSFKKFVLEKDLRKAIETKQFELFFQPMVQVRSNEVIGVEALIRWNHPTRGFISPLEFISMAEETGLITPISDWVLHKACYELRKIMESQNRNIMLSVNISARQFHRKNFVESIRSIVDDVGFPKELIKLEITENLLMKNTDETIKILKELQKLGIQVYIDDFGTGYSSLSYLNRFPINGVKIDRSFILNSLSNEKNKAIVKAIINLAHNLKLKVVAEGVETKEQLHLLEKYRCDIFQGFLFSRPQPIEHIRELL